MKLYWMLVAAAISAIVSMAVSVELGFLCLLFAATAWWVWEEPEGGLLLFLITAPLLPMFKATQSLGSITLIKDVIILTLFVRLVAWPLLRKELPYRRNIFVLPLIAFAGWLAVALVQADSHVLGILRARDIGLYILLYSAVLYLPLGEEKLKTYYYWLLGTAAVTGLLGIYQWFFAGDSAVLRFDPVKSIWIPRISATFGHPTVFGEFLVMLAGLAFAVVLIGQAKRIKLLHSLLFVLTLPFIYLTYSRGVWGGFVVALAGTAAAWQRKRVIRYGIPTAIIALAAIVGAVMFTPLGNIARTALDPNYPSNRIRLEYVARLVGPMSVHEAMTGRGLGDINQKLALTADEPTDLSDARDVQLSKDATLVDNQYLKTFVEMGFVGLLIYFWIYWRLLKTAWQLAAPRFAQYQRLLGLWTVGFVAAFLLQALFVDIWDVFPTAAFFWILAALVSREAVEL
jgi:hypothetical protein